MKWPWHWRYRRGNDEAEQAASDEEFEGEVGEEEESTDKDTLAPSGVVGSRCVAAGSAPNHTAVAQKAVDGIRSMTAEAKTELDQLRQECEMLEQLLEAQDTADDLPGKEATEENSSVLRRRKGGSSSS